MWLLRKGKNFGGVSSLHGRVYIKTAVNFINTMKMNSHRLVKVTIPCGIFVTEVTSLKLVVLTINIVILDH